MLAKMVTGTRMASGLLRCLVLEFWERQAHVELRTILLKRMSSCFMSVFMPSLGQMGRWRVNEDHEFYGRLPFGFGLARLREKRRQEGC